MNQPGGTTLQRPRTSRFDLTNCPQCRYDLTGSPPSGRCPECGGDYDESMFMLEVINRKLNTTMNRLEVWSSIGLALLLVMLGTAGLMPIGMVFSLFLFGVIAIWLVLAFYQGWRAWKQLPDSKLLFTVTGISVETPSSFRELCKWRDLRRVRLRRRRKRNRWTMALLPRVWRSFVMVQQPIRVEFRATLRETVTLRQRIEALADRSGAKPIRM